jgi:signal transduction histidine kinase
MRHATRDKLVIKVKDTGVGIKSKDRIKLFKLFGKLQNTKGMNT